MNCEPSRQVSPPDFGQQAYSRTFEISGITITRLHYREITTTMDAALPYARAGAHWVCVTADYQSSGRGTHGRTWLAPPGTSLMLSLVLPPPPATAGLETLSAETAAILRDVLGGYVEADFVIKQPNDLLIGGKKCAGILYESVTCDNAMTTLVLGMGVNLTQTAEDFIRAGLTDATSLAAAAGTAPGAEPLLGDFLTQFAPFYRTKAGIAPLPDDSPVQS